MGGQNGRDVVKSLAKVRHLEHRCLLSAGHLGKKAGEDRRDVRALVWEHQHHGHHCLVSAGRVDRLRGNWEGLTNPWWGYSSWNETVRAEQGVLRFA